MLSEWQFGDVEVQLCDSVSVSDDMGRACGVVICIMVAIREHGSVDSVCFMLSAWQCGDVEVRQCASAVAV